jgi:hypothetical protein
MLAFRAHGQGPEAWAPSPLSPKGYCSDYAYPSTGKSSGSYDDISSTASECMTRCQAVLPGTTSFYLKGTQCGCSATTSGACTITPNAAYTSYLITGPLSPKGYCSDWRYPSTGTTSGGYDDISSTASECMTRCQAVLPGTTSFYLKGMYAQCGCSATTSGACTITPDSASTSYLYPPEDHEDHEDREEGKFHLHTIEQ